MVSWERSKFFKFVKKRSIELMGCPGFNDRHGFSYVLVTQYFWNKLINKIKSCNDRVQQNELSATRILVKC